MLLLFHILIALGGVLHTTLLIFSPSRIKLRISYAFLALTLGSGFYLVWTTKTHMLQSCIMGLLYTGFVSVGIAVARGKLANMHND